MNAVLHVWAIVPAAVGCVCTIMSTHRPRTADAALSALMLIAMVDTVVTRVLIPVLWACVLIAGAMVHASAARGRRRTRDRAETTMALHSGIGAVVMAMALMGMSGGEASGAASTAGHLHGGGSFDVVVVVGAVVFVASAAWLARGGLFVDRLLYASMGAATGLMAIAVL